MQHSQEHPAEAGVRRQQGAAGLRHEALKMAKRKRALRSATPQAPEAATELTQLQAEVAQLRAELQEARAHSAQQEATRPSPHIKCHPHKTGHAECRRGRHVERTPPEDAGGDLTDAPVAARHLLPCPVHYGCRSP